MNISLQEALTKPPKSLSELLGSLEQRSRDGETLHFQRKHLGGQKNYLHSLTLTIHSESSANETLYFLSLRKIDSLLDLKAKNDLKTRLLSAFSHELKTPLNGSIPMLEALSASPKLDPDLRSLYLDNTLACLKLLDNSLSNILDFSLMASDQFLVNLGYFAVQELVFDALSIVRPQVKIKGLELFVEADAVTIQTPLNSDYSRGKQILLNILSNAVQFTNKGEILLKVTLCKDPDGVEFEVCDTGIGIPEPKLTALREKLALGIEERQVNSTGSCLGLTISNQLAMLLGVRGLEIESGESSGTSVRFMLKDQAKVGVGVGESEVRIRSGGKALSFLERSQETLQRMEMRRRMNFSFFHGISNKYIHAQSEDIEVFTKPEDVDTSNGLRRKLELHNFGGLIGAKIALGLKPDNNFNFYSKLTENNVNPFLHGEVKSPDFIQEASRSPSSGFGSGTKIDVFIEHNTLRSGVDVLRRRASAQHQTKGPAFFLNHKSLPLKELSKTGGVPSNTSLPMKEPYKMLSIFKEQSSPKNTDGQELAAILDSCSIVVSLPPQHECPQVLIVDDDAFNLFSLETLFRMFDYRCRKVMNGKEAVDFLVGQPKCAHCTGVRLVMMDYQMPVMDGVESTTKIMSLIKLGKITEMPVIGCTAFTAKNEISRCFEAGMRDVVFKPVSRGTVAMVVEQWLM